MNRIERLKLKLEKIEILVGEIRVELNELSQEAETITPRKAPKGESSLPTEEQCREAFDQLYETYLNGNSQEVAAFVDSKTQAYLRIFCKANNLSVDTKRAPKKDLVSEILKWFAQRKALTAKFPSN